MTSAGVIVLGAGPAGVGAAYRAASAGHRVVVLERAGRVGGAAGSFEVAGIRVDHGSHRLHPSTSPEVMESLRRLLGDDLQRRERRGRIRLAGRWIGYPLRAGDLARNLPPSFALRTARDAALSWTRSPHAPTFAEALRAGLGPTMCESFYFPYARKLWGLAPAEISAEQARRRVRAGSPGRILARVARGARTEGRTFYYPRRGYGQISEALAEAAADAGADLRLGARVERVRLHPGGASVLTAGGETVEGRHVWSTVPLPALARMVDPPPPPEVLEAAGHLRSRALALVYLVVPLDRYSPFDAHYLPEESTPVTRISEPKNYRDGDDPSDRTVLCFEIPCERGDVVWRASDPALGEIAARTLPLVGLPEAEVAAVVVRRLASAYPVFRVGYEADARRIEEWVDALPSLLTFGRQGLFVHDNAHHALAMAWAAADALRRDGSFDPETWAAARRRFAEHVVED